MGLTNSSTGIAVVDNQLKLTFAKKKFGDKTIALAGNPNVGKSTVFNALTGLNQHTGNWPGKTIANAQGSYSYKDKNFILVDIPGSYSLLASSVEEEIARNFICFGDPDTTVIVVDATCLERNLNLVLQILEATRNVVICVNLLDEAKKKKIKINLSALSAELGVPVVGTSANSGKGLDELMAEIHNTSLTFKETPPEKSNYLKYNEAVETAVKIIEPSVKEIVGDKLDTRWVSLRLLDLDESLHKSLTDYLNTDIMNSALVKEKLGLAGQSLAAADIETERIRDVIVSEIVLTAEKIYNKCVVLENKEYNGTDRKIDKILTSPTTGIPIMLGLLTLIFWITLTGANYPSELIASALFWVEGELTLFLENAGAPTWVHGAFVLGVYRTVAWVVSVMLPPMAIFFPLFTLLEDLGYLPRVAFNLDRFFKKCGAHGKQALTMCMGFGCNACGVIGCRIIDSPRERLIAILTNNFVPCNGRFPTLIAIITMFFAGSLSWFQSIASTLLLTCVIVMGVFMTLLVSKLLTETILKGLPSSFLLELPPFRKPQVGQIIVQSIFDRTLFVLGRAVVVAAPAGLIIWLMSNITVGDASILKHAELFLDPFAKFIGLDGAILLAFILGFPANEIVIPILIMIYMSTGSIAELDSLEQLRQLFLANGWTWVTAVCMMLFTLLHFPCGTTTLTIKRETGSWKWTALSLVIPTVIGIMACFIVVNTVRMFGLD